MSVIRLALSQPVVTHLVHDMFVVQARGIPGPQVYLAAAYWSLTTVVTIGFGDVTPSTDAERAVMLFVELAGVVFFGILLGSVTSLLQVNPTSFCLCFCIMV